MTNLQSTLSPQALAKALEGARARLDALADSLPADGWIGPYAPPGSVVVVTVSRSRVPATVTSPAVWTAAVRPVS